MNIAQKYAWSNLIIIAGTVVLTAAVVGILAWRSGVDKGYDGVPLVAFLGLLGISSRIFQKKRRKGGVNFDERDRLIYEKSLSAAHAVFWPFFVVVCIIPILIVGTRGSVPVYVLPIILGGGGVLVTVVQSLVILVQYGWGGKDNE